MARTRKLHIVTRHSNISRNMGYIRVMQMINNVFKMFERRRDQERMYDIKFAALQEYLPFLEVMIQKLQNVRGDHGREIQLQKMQNLHRILSHRGQNRLKIETLQQCENVLRRLKNKIQEFQIQVVVQ